nr:ribonuclease H-like domain-containing protein [Tanacetum cinerariifolium]
VIPSTSVCKPQLKSNPIEDRVLRNNSRGKKQEVEDHRRNVKLPKNKTFVTACNDGLNAKTLNVKSVSMCDKCVLHDKHDRCVLKYVAKPIKRTVASEPNKKPRNFTRKIYEHVSKTCSWWYPKSTPSGYIWKLKSRIENVNPNVSMPLGNNYRIANILDTLNPRLLETMLSAAKVPLFFWAEVIATACFTQNRSLVISRHEKTPYHIINNRKPSVKFFHIFGFVCYIVRDGENLDKMKEKGKVTQADRTVTTSNELDLLFGLMFDELLNGSSKVVSKSSAVSAADAPNQRQRYSTPLNNHTTPVPTCQILTLAPTVISFENINQAETHAENDQVADDEFINIFSTPVQDQGETSSRHVRSRKVVYCVCCTQVFHHLSDGRQNNVSIWSSEGRSVRQSTRWFYDPYHPDKVYRLKKVLYGLEQAPRAWYDELSKFLLSKGFTKGSIDPTLFITKHEGDILLVQIYVVDIILGSTNPNLSKCFEKLMHNKFEMSMMGELKFFLGIQIHQSLRGIFINQAKYAQEILVKHGMTSCDGIGTPMATKHRDANLSGTPVDQTKYRSKVGALMYLTASRPDIMHATCYCARYQAQPTKKHLTAVKRIFRYLKDTIHMGLWYPKDIGFELTAFSDSDHAGCLDSCKSTSGGIQFLGGDKLVKEAGLYFNVFRKSRVCVSIRVLRSSSMDENSAHRLWLSL